MDSNKVILLNPPGDKLYIRDYYCSFSSKADYYWPPQDLIYLSGILDEEYSVRVIDAIINKLTEDEVLSKIEDSGARALIFTTGTATMQSDLRLMKRIKAKTDMKIVASAGILPFIGEEFLKRYEYVDAVLLDFTSQDIRVYIRENGQVDVPLHGLITRKNGRFIKSTEKLPLTYTVP
ncbi:MAG: hypothetical protein V3R45_08550, partial [Candidatus Aminicenantaceae bacterium]